MFEYMMFEVELQTVLDKCKEKYPALADMDFRFAELTYDVFSEEVLLFVDENDIPCCPVIRVSEIVGMYMSGTSSLEEICDMCCQKELTYLEQFENASSQ